MGLGLGLKLRLKEVLPFVGMVIVQLAQVGQLVASKKAMFNGMTNFTFVFYTNVLASFILLPSSFLIHSSSRSNLPPLSFSIIFGCVLFGLLGFLVQILGFTGIQYASATLASAMLNLIPGFTFIFAVIFRMEKVDFKSSSTLAKFIGTIVSVVGAFIITFYKGPQFIESPSSPNFTHLLVQPSNSIIGGSLMAIDCMFASFFIIAQALILKKYPAPLLVTFFYSSIIAILSAAVSLIIDKDLSSWSLQPNIRLIAIIYTGLFGAAFQVTVGAWCLQRTGPLFVAMFSPLGVVISTIMGVLFLGDAFYLGSMVGSIVIIIGFYSVMWGKLKEGKVVEENQLSSNKAPLLGENIVGETSV